MITESIKLDNDFGPPIRVFYQLRAQRYQLYNFVEPFAAFLKHFVEVKTGRQLEAFIDIQHIEWGEDWKTRIVREVVNAAVFLPFVTATYLQSEMCRAEFNLFLAAAERNGLTGLLLPVVPFTTSVINAQSDDSIANYTAAHQYKNIETAILEGQDSASWRRALAELANDLVERVMNAEDLIAEKELLPQVTPVISGNSIQIDPFEGNPTNSHEIEPPGIIDAAASFSDAISALEADVKKIEEQITILGEIAKGADLEGNTAKELNIQTIRLANQFKQPSSHLERLGLHMLQKVKQADSALQNLDEALQSSGSLELSDSGRSQMAESLASAVEVRVVAEQMQGLLDILRIPEAMSAAIRKVLKPARIGITAIRDAAGIIGNWQSHFLDSVDTNKSDVIA